MQIRRRSSEEWQVSWTTISYRWLELLGGLLFLIAAFVLYLIFGARIVAFLGDVHVAEDAQAQEQHIQPAAVEIREMEGEVGILRARSQSWGRVAQGDAVRPGDALQTGRQGALVLSIADTFQFEIAPDSFVLLDTSGSMLERSRTRFRLTSGGVEFLIDRVRRGDEPQFLLADASFIPQERTRGRIRASAKDNSYSIVLLEGSGLLNRNAEGFRMQALQRVTFGTETSQLRVEEELAPPVLLVPQASLISAECPASVEFAWSAGPGASAYRFRMAEDRFFTTLLVEETLSVPSLRLRLPEGKFFWQVEGLKANRRVSLASSVGRLRHSCAQQLNSATGTGAS